MSASSGGADHHTRSWHGTGPGSRGSSGARVLERGYHLLTGDTTTPNWPGQHPIGRFGRALAASLVALAGLAFIAVGPTAVALGWHGYLGLRAAEQAAAEPVIGSEVRDGPVGFLVQEVTCELDAAWSVHGRLCEVHLVARNHGEEPVTIPGRAQALDGPDGLRLLPVSGPEPFGTLHPGDEETAVIEFDVPPHAVLTHVGVHADAYSEGVQIRLPAE